MNNRNSVYSRISEYIGVHEIALFLIFVGLYLPYSHGESVEVVAGFSNPVVLAGGKTLNYLKIGVRGLESQSRRARTPVNVALVLDRSGSMQGAKLEYAKKAAIEAVSRLDRRDFVSIVAYDDNVRVIVPATRAGDAGFLSSRISEIGPGGGTALFAGVGFGAAEVRKNKNPEIINRVILLSDGQANVGPSSTADLADLGSSLVKEGITVTALGLGLDYNEDLMRNLARSSDGNYAFMATPGDIEKTLDTEFGDILSVVAQEAEVTVNLVGCRMVRGLGREVEISGNLVRGRLNHIYAGQEKYILLEVEVDAGPGAVPAGTRLPGPMGGDVLVTLRDMGTGESVKEARTVRISTTLSSAGVEEGIDKGVMVEVVKLLARENYRQAVNLRDEGRVEEARQILISNAGYISVSNTLLMSNDLAKAGLDNDSAASTLDDANWNSTRKQMMERDHEWELQLR